MVLAPLPDVLVDLTRARPRAGDNEPSEIISSRSDERTVVTMVLAPLDDLVVLTLARPPRFPAGSAASEPLLSTKLRTFWPSLDAVAWRLLFLFPAFGSSKTATSSSSMIAVSELFFDPAPADAPARAKRCRLRNHLPIA